MKRLLLLVCLWWSAASAATVVVRDVLYYGATPTRVTGSILATPSQTWVTAEGLIVTPVPIRITVAATGTYSFSVNLESNTTASPAGTSYNVTYQIDGQRPFDKVWTIPSSGPVGISAIESTTLTGTTSIVALSQLSSGGATTGQCLAWTGTTWAPSSSCGSAPGLNTPNQLWSPTAPTWSSLTTAYFGDKFQLGTYPITSHFGGNTTGLAEALVGAVQIDASAAFGNHASGVSGYAVTASTSVEPVGGFFFASHIVNNGKGGPINGLYSNCGTPQCAENTGFDSAFMAGLELNFNVVKKSGGVTPNIPLRGIYLVGDSTIVPSNITHAFDVDSFGINQSPRLKWDSAYFTADGAATNVIDIGTSGTGVGVGSQVVKFRTRTGAGSDQVSSIQADANANFVIRPSSGLTQFQDASTNPLLDVQIGSIDVRGTSTLGLGSVVFASLGTPAASKLIYCTDCVQTNPCAGSGSGAVARREGTAWNCGGGSGGSGTANYSQGFTAQTSVALTHNAGHSKVVVKCYDNGTPPQEIQWNTLQLTDVNTATVTFTASQSGTCIVNSSGAGTGPTFLSGSAAIDFPSIGDGLCNAQTFTLTGALTTDEVAPRWPAMTAGMIGAMRVSASNTIRVEICNLIGTGSPEDLGSLTYGAMVLR